MCGLDISRSGANPNKAPPTTKENTPSNNELRWMNLNPAMHLIYSSMQRTRQICGRQTLTCIQNKKRQEFLHSRKLLRADWKIEMLDFKKKKLRLVTRKLFFKINFKASVLISSVWQKSLWLPRKKQNSYVNGLCKTTVYIPKANVQY